MVRKIQRGVLVHSLRVSISIDFRRNQNPKSQLQPTPNIALFVDTINSNLLAKSTLVKTMADADGYIDVSFAKDGGVMKKILKEAPENASGPPPKGNEVEAHYTGM